MAFQTVCSLNILWHPPFFYLCTPIKFLKPLIHNELDIVDHRRII